MSVVNTVWDMWKGKERQAAVFHLIGGIGIGLLISAWFGTFVGLGIILILIDLAGHFWAYYQSKGVQKWTKLTR